MTVFMSRAGVDHGPDESRYAAFISYRRDPKDSAWAERLHRELETYRVPKRLQYDGRPSRLGKCFRDHDELSAASNLSEAIEEALREAKFLIVVCSPRTRESQWVNCEVKCFREMGRQDRILALLIEGEPK